jgi:hypothetical protein
MSAPGIVSACGHTKTSHSVTVSERGEHFRPEPAARIGPHPHWHIWLHARFVAARPVKYFLGGIKAATGMIPDFGIDHFRNRRRSPSQISHAGHRAVEHSMEAFRRVSPCGRLLHPRGRHRACFGKGLIGSSMTDPSFLRVVRIVHRMASSSLADDLLHIYKRPK